MRKAAWGFFLVLVPLLAGRAEGRETGPEKPGKPLNVILMIGDGMGLSQLSTVYYYSDREPSFSRFTHIGLQRTSSATEAVTQSSAAATAMSTGVKTYNTAVGVGVDSLPLTNLVEKISPEGYLTGLVVTSSVTDATPAGFYAHQPDRYMFEDIAKDLLCSEIDFFAGAGFKYFRDSTVKDPFAAHGIDVRFGQLDRIENPRPGKRYGFLLAAEKMPAVLQGRKEYLSEASAIAVEYLTSGPAGFFLLIESSQIDWACHGNHADYLITEMQDFDRTIGRVLDFAQRDGNTLVIVTGDHETGGFSLSAKSEGEGENCYPDYSVIAPRFTSTDHSAALVPVFAFGPGAERFSGVYENTEIFHKITRLLGVD